MYQNIIGLISKKLLPLKGTDPRTSQCGLCQMYNKTLNEDSTFTLTQRI